MKHIAIIGGGAAGLMAACAAGSHPGTKVTLLEKNDRVGKKILATGNGRCNLTNSRVSAAHYHGLEPGFVSHGLEAFGVEKTLAFFEGLGLMSRADAEGRVYPLSNQASAVLEVLRNELARLEVILLAGFDACQVKPRPAAGFDILSREGRALSCDAVVFATGGLAAPVYGSDGSGLQLMRKLGHQVSPLRPALVQLRSDAPYVKALQGLRVQAGATLLLNGVPAGEETGEIQFTPYGLSGIPILQLSGLLEPEASAQVLLNLLPEVESGGVFPLLAQRRERLGHLPAESFFTGVFPKALGLVLCKAAGLERLSAPVSGLTKKELGALARLIEAFPFPITGDNHFQNAQVTKGGLLTRQFSPETMESKGLPGLYAAGEILDIYGDCGGYNLQWAWSSGWLAGTAAARINEI